MRYTKFFSIAVAVMLGLYGLIGFYFLPLANFEGDLTRMAKLPESMFGWTKPQPAIRAEDMQSAEWEDAEVLVIGDSFSLSHVWQTAFVRNGVHVRTESWGNINNLCGDISEWLHGKGFKGKYVIIESTEKYFEGRLADSLKCSTMFYRSQPLPGYGPPAILPSRDANKYAGRFSVGMLTALNAVEYERLSRDPDFRRWDIPGDVRLERVENGCKLFSHARCNDVLFYNQDRDGDFGSNVLDDMEKINARFSGYSTVWMVIPDKATVYLHPEKRFWDDAQRRFGAPNLLRDMRQAVAAETMDIYLANNTHVSTTGYLLLGDSVFRNMFHRSAMKK